MLSAAHVLAMDAKNLLDVVDSIRIRYPNLNVAQIQGTPQHLLSEVQLNQNIVSVQQQQPQQFYSQQNQDIQDANHQQQSVTYVQEVYDDQQQFYSNQQSGIYDNECVINQQLKNLELANKVKPQIASKPSNLNSKLKIGSNDNQNSLNEPLKIIEDTNDLYSNTCSAGISSSSVVGGGSIPSSNSNGTITLPEPVSCKIVQENLISTNQKIISSKMD